MATATDTSVSGMGGAAASAAGFGLTRHHVLRYVAAVAGLVALLLFNQPWINASLSAIGESRLTGAQMARGDARHMVDQAVFGGTSSRGAPVVGAPGAVGTGGVVLPTRQPTVAAGTNAVGAAVGGIVLPTRQPTVAAGGSGATGFGSTGVILQPTAVVPAAGAAAVGAIAQTSPVTSAAGGTGGTGGAAAPPAEPVTLPKFSLYVIPLAALGITAFSVVWDRLNDPRDRRLGRVWTLLLSYGGALLIGLVLYRIITAAGDNALLGKGVGSVNEALPALWGTFASFALASTCLTLAWLSPPPPAPDPYWRARAST